MAGFLCLSRFYLVLGAASVFSQWNMVLVDPSTSTVCGFSLFEGSYLHLLCHYKINKNVNYVSLWTKPFFLLSRVFLFSSGTLKYNGAKYMLLRSSLLPHPLVTAAPCPAPGDHPGSIGWLGLKCLGGLLHPLLGEPTWKAEWTQE